MSAGFAARCNLCAVLRAREQALANDFWRDKSIDELAREQGLAEPKPLADICGSGADLWESNEEFERFVADISERRRAGRARARDKEGA